MRLSGRLAIVTGAKAGIGLATAQRLAADGATVVLADIVDAADEAGQIVELGGRARFVRADVSKAGEVEALTRDVLAAFGRIDVLVANAGIELAKTIADTSEAEWDRLMAVNLKGVFLCARAVIPVMRRQGAGVIVNVASELGLVGGSGIAAYSASKGGVVQLTKSMAVDHARDGIRVNAVAPGPIATALLDDIVASAADPEAERQGILDSTLLKRLGRPEEIANVIAFLASDEASYMTGAIVVVDGGLTAR